MQQNRRFLRPSTPEITPQSYAVRTTTGVAVVEGYDIEAGTSSKLENISTRGFVQTGAKVRIAGVIVGGSDSQEVIVRALGPTLSNFGVANALADPTLEL